MEIAKKDVAARGVKLSVSKDGREVGRAFLYLMTNGLHEEPFGLMEDVFVEESERGQGYGTALVKELIEEAKRQKCYKLICTSRHSRPEVHALYLKLGFKEQGLEFRMEL